MRESYIDFKLDFGKLLSAGTFPNSLNLGKATPKGSIKCESAGSGTLLTVTAKKTESDDGITRTSSFHNGTAEIFFDEQLKDYPLLSAAVTGTGPFFCYIDVKSGE